MVSRAAMDAIRSKISANIATHGWHVTGVLPDQRDGTPSFAYSVGMTETLRHPELVIIGVEYQLAQRLINDVGVLIRGGMAFGDWDSSDQVIKGYPITFREIPQAQAREWARGASERYRNRGGFKLLQVFLPDAEGRFPWDEGADGNWAKGQDSLLEFLRPKLVN